MAKILVIDDDVKMRDTLLRMLDGQGHTLSVAADGQEGLSLFAADRPDLVITDIIMPNKEGIEIILAVKRIAPMVKILAISGGGLMNGVNVLDVARELGADGVLQKPLRRTEFAAAVGNLLAGETVAGAAE
ncbi:MAG TPA: response regulator [Stellaceae bacterium]|nr:response regulator [Stellaceae bacterium]